MMTVKHIAPANPLAPEPGVVTAPAHLADFSQEIQAVEMQRIALDKMILDKQALIESLYRYRDNLQVMLQSIG